MDVKMQTAAQRIQPAYLARPRFFVALLVPLDNDCDFFIRGVKRNRVPFLIQQFFGNIERPITQQASVTGAIVLPNTYTRQRKLNFEYGEVRTPQLQFIQLCHFFLVV
ncbi:hypothetical protein D3C75_790580 [compost metagenome]